MAKKIVLMGLFTDVMKTAEALDGLRLLGLREEDMSIMQGVPYTAKMLGRITMNPAPHIDPIANQTVAEGVQREHREHQRAQRDGPVAFRCRRHGQYLPC